MTTIERLDSARFGDDLAGLVTLLQDAVDGGASIGFLPPLSSAEAQEYWQGVVAALQEHSRVVLVAREGQSVVGTVQVDLAQPANGAHRAEVLKLMVHRAARRRGLGRALLAAAEDAAREAGRSLLVLDTRTGDAAEQLYRTHGYTAAGVIPSYARGADGALHPTVIFYKQL
jgi:ribosomal protein S18 acetylase RimI-like enzyme